MPRKQAYSSNLKAAPWIVTSVLMLTMLMMVFSFPHHANIVYVYESDQTQSQQMVQVGQGKYLQNINQLSQANVRNMISKYTLSAHGKVLAVNSQDNIGVIGYVNVEVRPGSGRLLVDTSPFVEIDTQRSAEIAVDIAQEITGIDLTDRDVTISFDIGGGVIGGPSAGASMTTAVISAITGKTIREDVAITGTIEPDGTIGSIGGLIEKAQAAAENGATLFLVPKGQKMMFYYEPQQVQERLGGFIITRTYYVQKQLDLGNYTLKEWGMETKEVANIDDVIDLMLEGPDQFL